VGVPDLGTGRGMDTPQEQLDAVYESSKEESVDAVLPVLRAALDGAGFEGLSRHVVYGWAEEISAGIHPKA
jgi:hypothetical protein